MDIKVSKGIKLLLENFWIDRKNNRDEYYEIKDNIAEIEKFFLEKVGWKIIINSQMIKLEKIPAKSEIFMGILEFKEIMDYCIFCGLLMILEDKEDGEQFLLSDLTDRIKLYLKEYIEVDWLNYSHRRSLVRAFEYAEKMQLIIKNDGEIKRYNNNSETEVLYEKTGFSRYFAIDLKKDISNYTSYEDLKKDVEITSDSGESRTNRVYRNLLTVPAIYWYDSNDADSIYIRNQKPTLENNLKKYIGGNLHIHKNSVFMGFEENMEIGEIHPKKSMLSEIVLLVCNEIRKKVISQDIKIGLRDFIFLSKDEFLDVIEKCRNLYGINWSKEYREMKLEKVTKNIIEYMRDWKLAEEEEEKIILYPAVGKIVGKYRRVQKEQ